MRFRSRVFSFSSSSTRWERAPSFSSGQSIGRHLDGGPTVVSTLSALRGGGARGNLLVSRYVIHWLSGTCSISATGRGSAACAADAGSLGDEPLGGHPQVDPRRCRCSAPPRGSSVRSRSTRGGPRGPPRDAGGGVLDGEPSCRGVTSMSSAHRDERATSSRAADSVLWCRPICSYPDPWCSWLRRLKVRAQQAFALRSSSIKRRRRSWSSRLEPLTSVDLENALHWRAPRRCGASTRAS